MKRLFALLLCLCIALCGCAKQSGQYVPTGDGLIYDEDYTGPQNKPQTEEKAQDLSLPYYPDRSLNPYSCEDFTNRALLTLLYQSLFTVDRDYVVEPQLCKSYSVSKDLKTYTFSLEAATFSDGSALTANDVVTSLLAARESNFYKGRFLHITEIAPLGGNSIVITLDTPFENLPLLLDIPIIKAEQIAFDRPMGTGPYTLYTAAGGESLHRRDNWWCNPKMPVTAETISLFVATSTTQIRDQFEFADLSLVCADPGSDRYADYRCDFELWDCENGIFLYLTTSRNSEIFSNDALRAALTYAIDRDTLVEDFYRGFARSASLPASPLFPYYSQNLADRYKYDDLKFLEAVKSAGVEGSTVVFLVNSADSLRLRVARAISKMLTDCGLVVELKALKGNAYTEALKYRNFDLYLGQTRLSPNMDLSAFFATYGDLSWGGVNDLGAYALSLQSLENHGNYFTLHKLVMDQGLICPILFRSYSIYADRGLLSDLTPTRDSVFYYSMGKTLEGALIS
ncbi:MAG: ABC transporter substrate-binding protein [Oscillospiraceae bacterium]|nr:ABC transporter substrate-binding protein [Oscillospiraceae bacterium]